MSNYIGVCHIHSNHSEDADLSIEELAAFFKDQNRHFVCLTDHNPKKDGCFIGEQEMAEIVKECETVSSDSFMIVPGLECETVDKTHILGIGITKPVHSKDWKTIVNEIHDQGGIAVLAHPHTFENSYDAELLELLDGIEVWNGNKDLGIPDVPTLGTISKMRRLKHRHTAFFGIDFHRQKDFKPLSLIYSDEKLSVDSLLRALKTEGYLLRSQKHDLGPLADFPFTYRAKWYAQGFLFFKSRYYAKRIQRFLDSKGITIPEALLKIPRKFYYH